MITNRQRSWVLTGFHVGHVRRAGNDAESSKLKRLKTIREAENVTIPTTLKSKTAKHSTRKPTIDSDYSRRPILIVQSTTAKRKVNTRIPVTRWPMNNDGSTSAHGDDGRRETKNPVFD